MMCSTNLFIHPSISPSILPSIPPQLHPFSLLTLADESLLGDGLLAYVATLGLLEGFQLEGVCVDAFQLHRLQ